MTRRRKHIKVVERKLARERAWGLCWQGEGKIEVDPRQRPRRYLKTLCHELLHHAFPSTSETRVDRAAGVMADVLWRQGFRRMMQ